MKSLIILAVSLALQCPSVLSQGRGRTPGGVWLHVMDGTPTTYRSQIAHFGDQFTGVSSFDASLMVPPGDPSLCEYPASLVNMTRAEAQNITAAHSQRPIALLISRGNCSFDTKARVAASLQQELTPLLRYVIVYNNNNTEKERENLVVMSSNATGLRHQQLESIGFVFVSTKTGDEINEKIEFHSNLTGSSPVFLEQLSGVSDNNNSNGMDEPPAWYLPVFGEVVPPKFNNGSGNNLNDRRGSSGRNSFYWLRFILFSLLILSPCVRAGYLWWSAGGRLMLRRNEAGRVTGVQYVRPMPYWFASGEGGGAYPEETEARIMTDEQVDALPELVYKKVKDEDGDDEGTETETKAPSDSGTEMDSVDVEQPAKSEQIPDATTLEEPEIVVKSEDAAPATAPALFTTCTMCSICIDEFEDGETIKILPKCRHGFHLECIKPWLTERQSCCPLCKTDVLDGGNDADDTTQTDDDNIQESPA